MKKYYEVLEIKEGASLGEIKKAYFRLAHRYHPDVCDDVDAEEKFKKINNAYVILKNQLSNFGGYYEEREVRQNCCFGDCRRIGKHWTDEGWMCKKCFGFYEVLRKYYEEMARKRKKYKFFYIFWEIIVWLAEGFWDTIFDISEAVWDIIVDFFETLWDTIVDISETVWDKIVDISEAVWDKIVDFGEFIRDIFKR